MSVHLAIDTAAPRLQLGLLLGDVRVDAVVEEMPTGQAEALFPRLAGLLERNGVGYNDISRIAVTTGPGSFTGLRIGLAAARGLGLALGVPVLGVPSLLAISLSAAPGAVSVLLDARRDEAYFERFLAPGVSADGPRLLTMEAARSAVEAGDLLIESAYVDIVLLARFAAGLDPKSYPPEAAYIRDADAKPQEKFRVARAVTP